MYFNSVSTKDEIHSFMYPCIQVCAFLMGNTYQGMESKSEQLL